MNKRISVTEVSLKMMVRDCAQSNVMPSNWSTPVKKLVFDRANALKKKSTRQRSNSQFDYQGIGKRPRISKLSRMNKRCIGKMVRNLSKEFSQVNKFMDVIVRNKVGSE